MSGLILMLVYLVDFLHFRLLLEGLFVTVTVVTVVFLRCLYFLILYITIYILISYSIYSGVCSASFLIVTTVTVTKIVSLSYTADTVLY